jgi:hypothetical protein
MSRIGDGHMRGYGSCLMSRIMLFDMLSKNRLITAGSYLIIGDMLTSISSITKIGIRPSSAIFELSLLMSLRLYISESR